MADTQNNSHDDVEREALTTLFDDDLFLKLILSYCLYLAYALTIIKGYLSDIQKDCDFFNEYVNFSVPFYPDPGAAKVRPYRNYAPLIGTSWIIVE